MHSQTIDEVIIKLEEIIRECIATKNRAGYFASLYHKVTCRVKEGILKNEFEDGRRMESLDVIFANRYLEAWEQWKNKSKTSGSWKVCFEATRRSSPLVLQHLLLGINAHINLDLGVAVVKLARAYGQDLDGIRNDYSRINMILASLSYEVMNDTRTVSPLLSLMGFHSQNGSILVQFAIDNARDGAWYFAEELSRKAGAEYNNCISKRDETITKLGQGLTRSHGLMKITLWLIRFFEWRNPARIIKVFHERRKQYIRVNK